MKSDKLQELASPTLTLGQTTPKEPSRNSSRLSSQRVSTVSSPSPSSGNSILNTPVSAPSRRRAFNYSPTASVETDTVSVMSTTTGEAQLAGSPSLSSRTSGRSSPVRRSASFGGASSSIKQKITSVFRRSRKDLEREEFTTISVSELDGAGIKEKDLTQSEILVPHGASRDPEASLSRSLQFALGTSHPTYDHSSSHSPALPSSSTSSLSCDSRQEMASFSLPNVAQTDHQSTQPLPRSFPSVDKTVTLARDKLEQLAQQNASSSHATKPPSATSLDDATAKLKPLPSSASFAELAGRNHRPSFMTIASLDSLATTDTLTESLSALEDSSAPRLIMQSITKSVGGGVTTPLSPVALLDQYIMSGRVVLLGRLKEIPLTRLEGIDWHHYGGCPHVEELGVMNGLVGMLHSQLLFERYQCQQHAKRNRQLTSRARTTSKLESEIINLVSYIL